LPVLFPGIPTEAVYAAFAYIIGRGTIKFFKNGGMAAVTGK
jgi:hypothetical protein